ncbi:MAG: hypothetical protein ACLFNR_02060 [Candidatus Paceibacterota bacterium]
MGKEHNKKNRSKKEKLMAILTASFISLTFLTIASVGVLEAYEPLQPLDSSVDYGSTSEGDFTGYVQGLLNLLIGVAALLAIIFITIGGIQYITTDSITNKESGKETINNALLGLLLALVSWLILYTINPNLSETFDVVSTT